MNSVNPYGERPWLKFYSAGAVAEVDIPVKSLGEAFDEAVEKFKNRDAIIFYGSKINYIGLKDKIDRLATALDGLGVKKGDVIALLLLNSPEYFIAFYAAAKIGAIITPISPVYVFSEIKHQLEDSGAQTVICQDMLYEGIDKTGLKLKNVIVCNISDSLGAMAKLAGKSVLKNVYQQMSIPSPTIYQKEGIHQLEALLKKYPPSPPKVTIDPKDDLLVLPYTGGTTGRPKGVMITHCNALSEVAHFKAFYPFLKEGEEAMVALMPLYHAGGLSRAVLTGLLVGHTMVLMTTFDRDVLLDYIVKYKVTFFGGAPSMFEMLKDYEKTRRVNWKDFKIITCGADTLYESTAIDWEKRTGTQLHEMYGMTEATGMICDVPRGQVRLGFVGIPVPNTMVAIADPEKDEFVPSGELGEVIFRGPQITKGYWNHPEATKENEAWINGERWWRTGDIGLMDTEGWVRLYDRKKDLIKYKGYRIYARDVEEVLTSHPGIKEAGVIGIPDVTVGENIKAYVVLEREVRGKLSEADILQYCQGKLTAYKIPKIIEFVGEIPKTDVGKVSRRELREDNSG